MVTFYKIRTQTHSEHVRICLKVMAGITYHEDALTKRRTHPTKRETVAQLGIKWYILDSCFADEAYNKEQPDVILCDMEFEEIQDFGCRVIECLSDEEIDIPFALYTNLEETDPRSLRAKKAGVSAIIPKTLHPEKLRGFLAKLKLLSINQYEIGFDGEMIGVYQRRSERQAILACRRDKGDTKFETPLKDQLLKGMIAVLVKKPPSKKSPKSIPTEPKVEI